MISFHSIQNTVNNYLHSLKEIPQVLTRVASAQIVRVAAVALAIFGVCAAAVLIYKHYFSSRKIELGNYFTNLSALPNHFKISKDISLEEAYAQAKEQGKDNNLTTLHFLLNISDSSFDAQKACQFLASQLVENDPKESSQDSLQEELKKLEAYQVKDVLNACRSLLQTEEMKQRGEEDSLKKEIKAILKDSFELMQQKDRKDQEKVWDIIQPLFRTPSFAAALPAETIKNLLLLVKESEPENKAHSLKKKILSNHNYLVKNKQASTQDLGFKTSEEIVQYCCMMGDHLTYLNLGTSDLKPEDLESISQACPNLKVLKWSNRNVSDACLAKIKEFKYLESLDLRLLEFFCLMESCQITDAGLAHLQGLANLHSLNLSDCNQITDAGLAHLQGLANLHSLDLSGCNQITDVGLVHLQGLDNLQSLEVRGCNQITDAGLAHLQHLTNLHFLNLLGCHQITGAGLTHLQGLANLHSLNLSGCRQITDANLAHLQGLANLHSLNLLGCDQITDAGLAHLQHLTNLHFLNLSGCNRITDAGLAHLQGLANLHSLDLSFCYQITQAGLVHLQGLANLQSLEVRGCNHL